MAGPYPLPTLACTIDQFGITAPSYADIIASLVASYKLIYGADVYLSADSQDYQMLAIFARAMQDANAATIAAYNSFSPATAQGAGLSSNVKINGLVRLVPTNSTADLTIVGTAGTLIAAGLVADSLGNQWALPATTIPGGGSIVKTAVCTVAGAIAAAPNTINQIVNPTRGWQTATNLAAAAPGAPVESDAALRQRQAVSTSFPAQATNAAIIAGVENVAGVTDVGFFENTTGSTDGNGVPGHSICVVVQGGDSTAIATAIANRKPPGTGTFGATTINVPVSGGPSIAIKFQRAIGVRVICEIDITALPAYVSTTGDAALAAVAAYVSGLPISGDQGGKVYMSRISAVAISVEGALSAFNVTAVKLARFGGGLTAADLAIGFDELTSLAVSDITLVVS